MRNEITAAVLFLVQLIEKNEKFSPDQVDLFRRRLIELLTERFRNHWFPDKPFKGQGYRCIRVNGNSRRDETLERAANAAGVKYEDLSLPVELTLWVDPHEVCCRFGESKGSYCTLASFGKEEIDEADDQEKENKSTEEFNPKQENSQSINSQTKSKPLSASNHNQQPAANNTNNNNNNNNNNNRRRNTNSPRFQIPKNRSWINNTFSMDHALHPMSHPWYNVMSPHFLGYPPPRQFIGHRPNKWVNHLPCYSSKPTRSYNRPFKPTLKV